MGQEKGSGQGIDQHRQHKMLERSCPGRNANATAMQLADSKATNPERLRLDGSCWEPVPKGKTIST